MDIEHMNVDHRQNHAPKNLYSKCHKFGHSSKYYRTQVPTIKHNTKGKGKVDIDQMRKEMDQKWKKKEED